MLYILSIHCPGHRAHPLSQTEYKKINWVSVSTFIVPSHLHSLPSLFLSSTLVLKITKSTTAKHACVLSRLQRNAGQVCHRLLLSCCSEKLWFHYDCSHVLHNAPLKCSDAHISNHAVRLYYSLS